MARKENIFMNQLFAKLPPEMDDWPIEKQMQHYCELYLHFSNRLTKWCGAEIEERYDLEETVDFLREVVMQTLMEEHGYIKDEKTDIWENAKVENLDEAYSEFERIGNLLDRANAGDDEAALILLDE